MNINQRNLYKYSQNLNLSSIAEIKNDENNPNSADNLSLTKNVEFLKDLANILENRLRTNIRLHQKGFEIYKQKLISDKNLIFNTINNDIKKLSINQLIKLLKQIKEENNKEKLKNIFNLQRNENSINNNNEENGQNSIDMINKMFSDYSNIKNIDLINSNKFKFPYENDNKQNNDLFKNDNNSKNNQIRNNNQNIYINNKLGFKKLQYNDPRLIYHSPSPLMIKKHESGIIIENKNVNNHIDFDEPQNC